MQPQELRLNMPMTSISIVMAFLTNPNTLTCLIFTSFWLNIYYFFFFFFFLSLFQFLFYYYYSLLLLLTGCRYSDAFTFNVIPDDVQVKVQSGSGWALGNMYLHAYPIHNNNTLLFIFQTILPFHSSLYFLDFLDSLVFLAFLAFSFSPSLPLFNLFIYLFDTPKIWHPRRSGDCQKSHNNKCNWHVWQLQYVLFLKSSLIYYNIFMINYYYL